MSDIDVEHQDSAKRFTARTPSGLAHISYQEPDERTMDLQSTVVPEADRGKGIGTALVRAAVDHARETGKRIVATCPFVKAWVERNPEARDVVK